jgi:hypothetical protein
MPTTSRSTKSELLELVGAIVLSTQDAEMYLKLILPFTDSIDPSVSGALARHEKLKKRTFGDLVVRFLDSSTSDSLALSKHLEDLVDQRNRIVHHFGATYGAQLRSGETSHVIGSLQTLQANVEGFRAALEQAALRLLETLRDVTLSDTPEYQDYANLCASFRQRIAS